MGKENSTPRPDPLNPNKRPDAAGAQFDSRSTSADGEATLDTGGSATAAARALDRATIGPYILLRKLGEGGMGQVWLAEQTAPVRRQVALKLIRGGLYDAAMMHRFESERQSLAIMNHPAIAKVFDAGATKDGQPYFVMEHVDGLPITGYCDNKKLKMRERLQLFVKVCEGVQHAHQKAIIHRDLKPSNVLVTEVDGKAVPRIIDFGLAKAMTTQPGDEQSLFTQMGGLVGTRGFMSPEQADPAVLDVDTRTDVYSLGVILYVLLAGALPFDPEQWKKKPFDELLRQLREEDPPSPSAKLSQEKDTAKDTAAANRGTEPKQLIFALRGDLDRITMKAVEKDRSRRYGTPSELAADIERYLENRPIVARPATTRYRLRKYVRRHRLGVAVAASAAALLVAFAVTQAIQLRRITRERDRANRITDFMTNMFKVSDPSESRGNTITAREILDKGSKDIDTGLAKDPELQTELMNVMGGVYHSLGLYPRSEALLRRTADIRRNTLGPENRQTLQTMSDLGYVIQREGRYADAEKVLRAVLASQLRVVGLEQQDTLQTMDYLGFTLTLEGNYSEAEKLLRQALEGERRVIGPEKAGTLATMDNLASTLAQEGRSPEAERLFGETIDLERRAFGPDDPRTLMPMLNLGATLLKDANYAEAEKVLTQVVDSQRKILGPEHPSTLGSMYNLSLALKMEGKSAEAEKLQREVLDAQRRLLGPEHPNTLAAMSSLGATLRVEGHYAEAEKLQREALEIQRRILGPQHTSTLVTANNLASTLQSEGRYAEAERLQRQTLDIRRGVSGLNNRSTLRLSNGLAATLRLEGKYAESEELTRATLEIERRTFGPNDPDTADSTYGLACIAAHKGQRDEALSFLSQVIGHGLSGNVAHDMVEESDLKSLRNDPRFQELVAHAKELAATPPKAN